MQNGKGQNLAIDVCIFYERTTAHLNNTRPLKKNPNLFKNSRYCTVNACMQHKIYPVSQQCTSGSTTQDHSLPNCQIAGRAALPYKKGRSTCFAFFDFLKFFQENTVYIVQQRFCKLALEFKCPPCDPF